MGHPERERQTREGWVNQQFSTFMGFPLTPRSMTLDDLELLQGQILLEFRDISRVSDIT